MVDDEQFKAAMSRFPAGVTLVTTREPDGTRWGFTASSFASLSLDPALVLVCLDCTATCAPVFKRADAFVVNILGPDQADVARQFGSKGIDKFAGVEFDEGANGHPVLPGSVAGVECDLQQRHQGGDHMILIGHVTQAWSSEGEPLLYVDRAFHHVGQAIDPGALS